MLAGHLRGANLDMNKQSRLAIFFLPLLKLVEAIVQQAI